MAIKKTDEKLNFIPVEDDALTPALAKRFAAVREALKAYRDERAAFETQFTAFARKNGDLDEGKDFAFGYKFGGLAVAVVDAKTTKTATKAASKPTFRFSSK